MGTDLESQGGAGTVRRGQDWVPGTVMEPRESRRSEGKAPEAWWASHSL